MPRRILSVVGARPNFIKIGPLLAAFEHVGDIECVLLHSGQHYDTGLSDVFFDQLGVHAPDIHLGVGPGSHAAQTAAIMVGVEKAVGERRPDLVLVVGDVNSTVAAALVAAKAGIPLAHVEAGLRSFDRRMPEEVNRVVTDALASFLFATEDDAVENLVREGVPAERVFLVGNVMIDTLIALLPAIRARRMSIELGLEPGRYGVVTLHRPSNVDDPAMLARFHSALLALSDRLPLVFPVHPRTAGRLVELGLAGDARLRLVEPLPYVEFLSLVADAVLVLTDSGGVQEETTWLGVPCLTLRDTTERPVTVRLGTNILVGTDPRSLAGAAGRILDGGAMIGGRPPLWDGATAERIARILADLTWTLRSGAPSRASPPRATWPPVEEAASASEDRS